jgi:Flp pilus assembly protein TadD
MQPYARAMADSDAIRRVPDNPGGWNGRGFVRLATQDFKGAVSDLNEAIHLSPNESGLYLNRAMPGACSRTKNLAGALKT